MWPNAFANNSTEIGYKGKKGKTFQKYIALIFLFVKEMLKGFLTDYPLFLSLAIFIGQSIP
ncbi:hypothetical protein AAG747_01930 [Rapidithrix thailandica]|uniref:Uncharacterized protein n=1 Tax=Rapidithrix thailandica TaxID=413964 RepID=A0AAW9RST0_9BACT